MVTEVLRKAGCGWCITGHHNQCVGYVKSYDVIYVCGCPKGTGCGVTAPRNLERTGDVVSVPMEKPVEEEKAPEADEATERVLLDEPVEDREPDPVQPAPKRGRPRKKAD